MSAAIMGRKVGMTRWFLEDGTNIPVTIVEAGPCIVTQVKTEETDGYAAVQFGFSDAKPRRTAMAQIGHDAKAGTVSKRVHREFRCESDDEANGFDELGLAPAGAGERARAARVPALGVEVGVERRRLEVVVEADDGHVVAPLRLERARARGLARGGQAHEAQEHAARVEAEAPLREDGAERVPAPVRKSTSEFGAPTSW